MVQAEYTFQTPPNEPRPIPQQVVLEANDQIDATANHFLNTVHAECTFRGSPEWAQTDPATGRF